MLLKVNKHHMKIVVFGGGSMGLAYANLLHNVSSDVILFTRRSEQVEAINKDSISLVTNTRKNIVKVFATNNAKDLADSNIVIVLVKNYDSENAAKVIAANTKDTCVVMTTESGIGVEKIYHDICKPRTIVRAVSYLGAKRLSDTETQIGEN